MIIQLPDPLLPETFIYVEPIHTKRRPLSMLMAKKGVFASNDKTTLTDILVDAYYSEIISDPSQSSTTKICRCSSIEYSEKKLRELLDVKIMLDTDRMKVKYNPLDPCPFVFQQGYTRENWKEVEDWISSANLSIFSTGKIVTNFSDDWLYLQLQTYFLRYDHEIYTTDHTEFKLTSYRTQNDLERTKSMQDALHTADTILCTYDEDHKKYFMKQLETYCAEYNADRNCKQFLQMIDGALHVEPGEEKYAMHQIQKELNNLFAYISERYEEIKK